MGRFPVNSPEFDGPASTSREICMEDEEKSPEVSGGFENPKHKSRQSNQQTKYTIQTNKRTNKSDRNKRGIAGAAIVSQPSSCQGWEVVVSRDGRWGDLVSERLIGDEPAADHGEPARPTHTRRELEVSYRQKLAGSGQAASEEQTRKADTPSRPACRQLA